MQRKYYWTGRKPMKSNTGCNRRNAIKFKKLKRCCDTRRRDKDNNVKCEYYQEIVKNNRLIELCWADIMLEEGG